jgi:hypothetical protein
MLHFDSFKKSCVEGLKLLSRIVACVTATLAAMVEGEKPVWTERTLM